MKISRTFRLSEFTNEQLEYIAKKENITETRAIEKAITFYRNITTLIERDFSDEQIGVYIKTIYITSRHKT